MAVEALKQLPKAQPRRFVPETIDLGAWDQLVPLFAKLQAEGGSIRNAKDLEAWVIRCGELGAALDQEGSRRHIDNTCQTDDKEAEQAHLHFVEHIEPQLKPEWQKLDQLFLACPYAKDLPPERWMVFVRETKKDVELFREENIPLQTEDTKLGLQYQKITGAMTVRFKGKEHTLQQMGAYLEQPDRDLREVAWQLITFRRMLDRERIEDLYDQLLGLRAQIARNAGFKGYREYAFRAKSRFDYTPAMCADFHKAVEELVVPMARQLQERRKRLMQLDQLRPWDNAVDPRGRTPLKPFENVEQFIERTHGVFRRIDNTLADDFGVLRKHGLLELESRKGKAPGGYLCPLTESGLAFIFMNAVGLQRDVETLLHESGHAFHALATKDEPILMYRSAPMEFCEVASMSMELLGGPHLDCYYSREDARRARRVHLEGIVGILPWIAIVDAFQHWIYTHPGHTRAERRAEWLSLLDRFGGKEDWSGFEEARACMWQRQLHIILLPFYYIEYGIAQLGALQVWLNSKRDVKQAVADYRKALALGRSRPLPELFKAAGAEFEFSAKTVKPLAEAIGAELKELEDA